MKVSILIALFAFLAFALADLDFAGTYKSGCVEPIPDAYAKFTITADDTDDADFDGEFTFAIDSYLTQCTGTPLAIFTLKGKFTHGPYDVETVGIVDADGNPTGSATGVSVLNVTWDSVTMFANSNTGLLTALGLCNTTDDAELLALMEGYEIWWPAGLEAGEEEDISSFGCLGNGIPAVPYFPDFYDIFKVDDMAWMIGASEKKFLTGGPEDRAVALNGDYLLVKDKEPASSSASSVAVSALLIVACVLLALF